MFSILVPTYNRSKILKRCLDSIKNQDFNDYEVFILDDCSKDDTESITKLYTQDSRFKYIKFEKNHGQGVFLINFIVKNRLHKHKYIISIGDDDFLSKNFLKECSKITEFSPDMIATDWGYSFGNITILNREISKTKTYFSNPIKKDDINFLKIKAQTIYDTNFFINNDIFEIKNGETAEVSYQKYYKFAKFGYAPNAYYIFDSSAQNRRKYVQISNWILSMANLSVKNAMQDGKFNKNDFIDSWYSHFNDQSHFLHGFIDFSADEVLEKILINFTAEEAFLKNIQNVAQDFHEKYQDKFYEKYLALNAKLHTFNEMSKIIAKSKTFMVYCKTDWGMQIKEQLEQKSLKFLGFLDDNLAMSHKEFLSSNLTPDFIYIATGRPKLMSTLLDNLSGYKGEILTLRERDDEA